jgi:uncharacterized membrane protein
MDLHPILVHFPIGLLTIYAILELIRFKKIMVKPHWFHTKATFAIIGALFACLAYLTGPEGGEGTRLHEMHHTFATFTLIIFFVIALAYLLEWIKPSKYSLFIMRPYIIIPLAILGLICITITGGLGGAMVYGTHFDPFMAPVFKFLGVY